MGNKNIIHELIELTTSEDEKAELTLLAITEGKCAGAQRDICKKVRCPWDELLRLRRKYRRVLERYREWKGLECQDTSNEN